MAINDSPPFVDGYPLPAVGLNSLAPLDAPDFTGQVLGDRAFFGAGTPTSNWAETLRGTITADATLSAVPLPGNNKNDGITAAIRSSDVKSPSDRNCLSLSGLAVNDEPTVVSAVWGGYFESWRAPGVISGANAIGIEIDAVETNSGVVSIMTPYVFPPDLTAALWLASGANLPNEIGQPVYPATVAIGIVANPQTFRKGVVFHADVLDTTIGAGSNGVAVEMARGQSVRWENSSAGTDAEIWGSAEGLEVGPHGIVLSAVAEPATPAAGKFVIFMDIADNRLKAKGPSGTVTPLANP